MKGATAMDENLISITDGNSILISVEFIDSGHKTKTGSPKFDKYTIDIIVARDLKCKELLKAIECGLSNRLSKNDADICSKCCELRDEIKNRDHCSNCEKKDNKDECLNCYVTYKKLPDGCSLEANSSCSHSDSCEDIYAECKILFCKCHDFYQNPTTATNSCIGIGSVSLRKFKDSDNPSYSYAHDDTSMQELITETGFLSYAQNNQIWLNKVIHHDLALSDSGFLTSTRLIFDPVGWHTSAPLYNEDNIIRAFSAEAPLYNISDNPYYSLEKEPVRIIPPTDPPQKNKQNITSLLTPLVTSGTMLFARLFFGGGVMGQMLIVMSVAMMVVAFVMYFVNKSIRDKEYKESVDEWKKHYQIYIKQLLDKIIERQNWSVKKLTEIYPSRNTLIQNSTKMKGDIFSRSQSHPDFMAIRLGVTISVSRLIPSVFPIIGEKKEVVFTSARYKNLFDNSGKTPFTIMLPEEKEYKSNDSYLIDLPSAIAGRYAYLKNAPVLLRLAECGSLGVIDKHGNKTQSFLDNLIFELCYYHSPDELQCIMFCKETKDWREQEKIIGKYKHLSHFRELLGSLSAFSFDKRHAEMVLNKLLELLTERKDSAEDVKYPHIVVFFQEEDDFLKRHPVSLYLPDGTNASHAKDNGLTFIFFKEFREMLPKYCEQTIEIANEKNWQLFPHNRELSMMESEEGDKEEEKQYGFAVDPFFTTKNRSANRESLSELYPAFKMLSAMYYFRIAQGGKVPSRVELSELHNHNVNVGKSDNAFWDTVETNIGKSLAVPVGKKADNEIVELDLYEKKDGPHMLVAGTTGSGKSETLLTFLIGLCARYSPDEVNLLLVDMKGGGFIERLGDLPHIVGKVSDIDGDTDEGGAGSLYMLKRFLHSMNAEVTHRKVQFKKMGVDSIDKYFEARGNIAKHIKKLNLDPVLDATRIEELEMIALSKPLPHLFVVVDEFTELMRFSGENNDIDFKAAIDSLIRVGRSLGFHIILASQNIEGAISDEIRVNVKARLCLKVATRGASREMIGTDNAYGPLMPSNGRSHLLVGAGSRYEYFQSGYSSASTSLLRRKIVVVHAEKSGPYTEFYNSHDPNSPEGKKLADEASLAKTQLQSMVEDICKYFEHKKYKRPRQVLQPPLCAVCYYDFEEGKVVDIEDMGGED